MLVAEKITDQIAFIGMIRKLTGSSISEIRQSIAKKCPFFECHINRDEDGEKLILEILRFAKKQGDKIKILEQVIDTAWEMSEEVFHNTVNRRKEISRQFEELDELEYPDEDE